MEARDSEKHFASETRKEDDGSDHGANQAVLGQGMNRIARISLILSVLCSTFLFALDTTIVAVIQPRIIQQLGEIDKLPWIIVAFELGGVSANLCWGKLFGSFDQKILFIASVVLFEVGSAVCGAAPTMNALIIGRVIAGIGGNGIYCGTMNIVSNLTSIQERPLYLAFFGLIWAIGVVLGPIIGGAFAANSHTGWRWSFYINLCVAVVLAPIYIFLLPSYNPQKDRPFARRLKQLDWLGTVLFCGAYTAGAMAISFGGVIYDWNSARIIALFCVSGVLWVTFVLQQAFCVATDAENRLFPAHLLYAYDNWILFAQTALSIAALFLTVYFIPLYFQFVRGDSPLESGVRLLPLICVAVVFCLLNGGLMGKFGYYMPWFVGGSAVVVVGSALMRTIGPDSSDSKIYGYSALLGAGIGAYVQASFPVAQAKHPAREVSNVLAFIGCAQLTGLTLSFSIGNAVFLNRATTAIHRIIPSEPRALVQAAIAGLTGKFFQQADLSPDVRERILGAVSDSITDVYTQLLAGAALSLLLSLFLKREKLFMA